MTAPASKWARSPRPSGNLAKVGAVRETSFESDFFSTPCLEVAVDGRRIRYVAPNRMTAKRVHTLFTKEPTTIPWLDTFSADDVFFDIGANIGLYSIYAGVMTGARVYCFEPEALNNAEINKNIFINGLHDRVKAYNIAISDETRIGELFLGAFGYSYSHHDFNENTWAEDHYFGEKGTRIEERLHQGCVALPLDDLVGRHGLPVPQHIKVDVDGLENRVFNGMRETLKSPAVKTVLFEIDFRREECASIIDGMTALGWRFSMAQLRANRKKILADDDISRMRRRNKGGLNYVFFKDGSYDDLFDRFLDSYVPPMAPKS